MIDTIFRVFPKGIEEVTIVLGLLGFLLFLLSPRVKPGLKLTFTFLLLISILWRVGFSRFKTMSSRYVAGLIIPFIILAVFFFQQLQQKKMHIVRWGLAILMALLLLNYIKRDLKRNKNDMNYWAIAEIIKKSNTEKKEDKYLVSRKEYNRILQLSKTDNIINNVRSVVPYKNNFEKPYFPSIIDVDSENNYSYEDSRKHICSFLTGSSSKKKINLYYSPPDSSINLKVAPLLESIDTTKNLLQNGALEAVDSADVSHEKLVTFIANYSSYFEYDESVRTPQNAYYQIMSGAEKLPTFRLESGTPIDGQNSVFMKFNDGKVHLFFNQAFRDGQYSYSFLIQGKRGTLIQPVYKIRLDGIWTVNPICHFSIPDSRIFQISCSFDIDNLKNNDFFFIGVRVQDGETLLDDFILTRKNLN